MGCVYFNGGMWAFKGDQVPGFIVLGNSEAQPEEQKKPASVILASEQVAQVRQALAAVEAASPRRPGPTEDDHYRALLVLRVVVDTHLGEGRVDLRGWSL